MVTLLLPDLEAILMASWFPVQKEFLPS